MRFEIGIMREFARADPGAIDHEIEFWIDIVEFFEANAVFDFATGFLKTIDEIIEIDGRIH